MGPANQKEARDGSDGQIKPATTVIGEKGAKVPIASLGWAILPLESLEVQLNVPDDFLRRRCLPGPPESGAKRLVPSGNPIPRGAKAIDVEAFAQFTNELNNVCARLGLGQMLIQHAVLHRRQRKCDFYGMLIRRHDHIPARWRLM